MPIKALIIDDEKKSIEVLRMLIEEHCPGVKIMASAENLDKAASMIETHHPELVFLDIDMGVESGFDLLEKIQQRNFHVIFVTAHSHFAVKAFRFSVADYLLKPVDIGELQQAVEKVKALIETKPSDSDINNETSKQTLRIPSTDGAIFVYINNIIRMEADGAYTQIYIDSDGRGFKRYVSSYRLKQFEEHLDSSVFMRIHRSHIINMKKIKSIVDDHGLSVLMNDGATIEVAKRNRADFLKRIH